MQARLKLTIPREPNLETAYRTQRMRWTFDRLMLLFWPYLETENIGCLTGCRAQILCSNCRSKHHTEVDQVALNVHRFKARPLNRKVCICIQENVLLYKSSVSFPLDIYTSELQILEAPSLPLPKKSTPRLPEFQVSPNNLSCPLTKISLLYKYRWWLLGNRCLAYCSRIWLHLHIASQEFHLKTSERARQHTTGSSSSLHCNDPDKVIH